MKTWICIVLAVVVIGGGIYLWSHNAQTNSTATLQTNDTNSQNAALQSVPKVGDKIGSLTVVSVKNTPTGDPRETIKEIKFTGTVSIVGTSIGVAGEGGGQMVLKKTDNSNLPRFVLESGLDQVYFTTGDDLPGDGAKYTATVSDYTMYVPSDPKAWNTDGGHVVSIKAVQ